MTIKPGESWGRRVDPPDDLVVVDDDRALATALTGPHGAALHVRGGDLARTLGSTGEVQRDDLNEFLIDLVEVSVGGSTHTYTSDTYTAVAHVVIRPAWSRGGWLRGRIVVIMNAEFRGDWDVAPRGHPNDGRVETFEIDRSMSLRQRLSARRRVRTGTHVPHPQIATRSVRSASWDFDRPMEIIVDGRRIGRGLSIAVSVVPDAAIVYA